MKRKVLLTLAIMFTMSATMTGCGNANTDNGNSTDTESVVSDAGAPDSNSVSSSAIKSNSEVIYNGTTIKLGDNLNTISDQLGAQSAPSAHVVSCIAAATISQYYYPGMTIEITDDGIIYSIEIRDNGYAGDIPTTSANITLGSDVTAITNVLGTDNCQIYADSQYCYTDGTYNVQYDLTDGEVSCIWIYDTCYVE